MGRVLRPGEGQGHRWREVRTLRGQGAGRSIYEDTEHIKNYGWSGVREEGSESGAKLLKE